MWESYVSKRGSLNVGMRVEQGFALIAALIQIALGNKNAEPKDYMPHFDQQEISLAEAMKTWS